jgi:hypothetical protein
MYEMSWLSSPFREEIAESRDKQKIHLHSKSLTFHSKPVNIVRLIEETFENQEEV